MIKTGISLYKEFKNEIIKCTNNSLKQSSNEKDEDIDDIKLGYPKSDDEDKTLLAIIVKNPEIVNGIDTDLQIDAPVFDIEFKLLGE